MDADEEVFDGPPQPEPQPNPPQNLAADPCCICMVQPKNTILLPCGHVATCDTCAALLEAQGIDGQPEGAYNCPVCRTPVTSRHRLYYAWFFDFLTIDYWLLLF